MIKTNKFHILICFLLVTLLVAGCGREIEDSKGSTTPKVTPESDITDYNIIDDHKENLLNEMKTNDALLTEHAYDLLKTVDFVFSNGETPLTFAMKYSKPEILNFILEKTTNFNLRNSFGETALIISIKRSKRHTLNRLIKRNIDLNYTDENGIAPLMYAYKYASEKVIIRMLKFGANGSISNENNNTFLSLLKLKKYNDAYDLLKRIQSLGAINKTSLENAVNDANTNLIEYLLITNKEFKLMFDEVNFLFNAINIEDPKLRKEITRLLLRYGASPNHTEKLTPLIHSVIFDLPETTSLLISYRADPLQEDQSKRNALSYAVETGNYEIVKKIYAEIYRLSVNERYINLYKVRRKACTYIPSKDTIRQTHSLSRREVKNISYYLNCDD